MGREERRPGGQGQPCTGMEPCCQGTEDFLVALSKAHSFSAHGWWQNAAAILQGQQTPVSLLQCYNPCRTHQVLTRKCGHQGHSRDCEGNVISPAHLPAETRPESTGIWYTSNSFFKITFTNLSSRKKKNELIYGEICWAIAHWIQKPVNYKLHIVFFFFLINVIF